MPFESTLVQPWEIQFVNAEGNPVAGVSATISCQHYTYFDNNLCGEDADSRQETGVDGKITFSRKSFRLSLISRIARSLVAYPLILAHGSVGRDIYVIVSVPIEYESVGIINYVPGEVIKKVVLKGDVPEQ